MGADPIRDDGLLYVARLRELDAARVEHAHYAEHYHGFMSTSNSNQLQQDLARFIDAHPHFLWPSFTSHYFESPFSWFTVQCTKTRYWKVHVVTIKLYDYVLLYCTCILVHIQHIQSLKSLFREKIFWN